MKPDAQGALQRLKDGNQRFASGRPSLPNQDFARRLLAFTEDQGQHAYATVIDVDSRVPVELIFDSGIMDLFVVRVAGNVCNVDECGCIEYGLSHVHTPVLVVLGHTQCGAVTTVTLALQGAELELERNIPPLVESIKPAVERAMAATGIEGDAIIPRAIEENVWEGIHRLFLGSPSTRKLVRGGEVIVVVAVYDIGTGVVSWLPEERVFDVLDAAERDPGCIFEP